MDEYEYGWQDPNHNFRFRGNFSYQPSPAHRHIVASFGLYECNNCYALFIKEWNTDAEQYATPDCAFKE